MEEAGQLGLCLEGRIEIGAAEARRLRPDLSPGAALVLATACAKRQNRHGTDETVP